MPKRRHACIPIIEVIVYGCRIRAVMLILNPSLRSLLERKINGHSLSYSPAQSRKPDLFPLYVKRRTRTVRALIGAWKSAAMYTSCEMDAAQSPTRASLSVLLDMASAS